MQPKGSPNLKKRENVKFKGLQVGRGIAAMLVILHHTTNHLFKNSGNMPFAGIFHFGRSGVDFFFVLSGFIIFFIHHKDLGYPSRLGFYLYKRFTRIYPIYWVAISVIFSVSLISGKDYSLVRFFEDATLLPGMELSTLGVAWTLRYEVLFYALFAIAVLSRKIGSILLMIWLSTVVLNLFNVFPSIKSDYLELFVSAWNLEFMMGVFSAYYLIYHRLKYPKIVFSLALALFLFFGGLENYYLLDGSQPVAHVCYGFCAMLILIGLVELERTHGIRIPNLFFLIGEASYSIYLMHLLFIGIVYKILDKLGALVFFPDWITYIILFICATCGGVLFYLVTEKQILKLTLYLRWFFEKKLISSN